MSGAPTLQPPRAERFPDLPAFQGPRQTTTTTTGRADMIAFWVFVVLIVLGLIASARALLVM